MSFLNRKAVQFTVVDKPKTQPFAATPKEQKLKTETVDLIVEKSKEVLKYAALTAVGAYAAVKAVDTLSKIALKKTKSADNED